MRRWNELSVVQAKATKLAILSVLALLIGCVGRPSVGPISPASSSGRVPGALEWPVRGALVSAYRPPNRPSHAGVDLAAPPGTLVIAAEAGSVVYTGEIRGYERVVAVAHAGELTTVYAHLGEMRVREGAAVARGQAIATVGESGYLHYEIRRVDRLLRAADLYAIGPTPDEWATAGSAPADVSAEPAADVPIGSPRPPAPPSQQRSVAAASLAPVPPPPASVVESRRSAPPPAPAPLTAPGGTLGGDGDAPAAVESSSTGESSVPMPAVVAANVLYVPAKLVYSGLGAVTGVFVLAASQDTSVAGRFWDQTLGGDYFVTGEHLSGERGVHWMGTAD